MNEHSSRARNGRSIPPIVLGLALLFVSGAGADDLAPLSTTRGGDLVVAVPSVGLLAVDPDTGAARTLDTRTSSYWASFSSDGTRMLFFDETGLMVADGDGSNAQSLIADSPVEEPKLSPDGNRIAFLRGGALYVRNLRDPTSVRKLTSPPPNTRDNSPEWAPSGDRILVGRWTQPAGTAVVSVGAVGGENVWVHNGGGIRFPANGVLSPDGRRMATLEAGGVAPGGFHVTVWNADGTDPRVVTPNRPRPAVYGPPAWSPDGRMLAFHNWDTNRVDVVDAEGGAVRTIFSAGGGYILGVTWRPKGSGVTVRLPDVEATVPRRPLTISGAVRSIGSEPATSVTATISTTNGTIARASLNGTRCTAARRTATCAVASIPGDTNARLIIVLVPSKPGAAAVSVSSVAANDAQHDDDTASLATTFSQCTILGTAGADRLAVRGDDYVCGLAGDDLILARNGKRDIIDGGAGSDTALVDRIDIVRHVERVRRPKR